MGGGPSETWGEKHSANREVLRQVRGHQCCPPPCPGTPKASEDRKEEEEEEEEGAAVVTTNSNPKGKAKGKGKKVGDQRGKGLRSLQGAVTGAWAPGTRVWDLMH